MQIKLENYIGMIKERAYHYGRKYGLDHEDMLGQGYLIYCKVLKTYSPAKASFSTFLYTNLSGRLQDYALRFYKKNGLDTVMDTADDKFIGIAEKEKTSKEAFLEYAECHLSAAGFKMLGFLLESIGEIPGSNKKPSVHGIAVKMRMPVARVKTVWQEVGDFWQNNGYAYFAEV